jgi:hypothetical protein
MEAVGRAVVVGVGKAAPLARVRAGTVRVVLVVVMAGGVGAGVMALAAAAVGIGTRAPLVRVSASSPI